MTNEVDELAWDIFRADNSNVPEHQLRGATKEETGYARKIAEALIAAGWEKPVYLTDAQLYDVEGGDTTLPNDTVVESADGSVWRVEEDFGWDCVTSGSASLSGPARLLVMGGQE